MRVVIEAVIDYRRMDCRSSLSQSCPFNQLQISANPLGNHWL